MMRRFQSLALTVMALLSLTPAAAMAQDITSGLVGHWEMNQSSGADPDASGTSGPLTPAAAPNDPTWDAAAGKFGNGLHFNTAQDDKASVADSPSLDLASFTLSAWVKLSDLGGEAQHIIEKGEDSGELNYYLGYFDDALNCGFNNGGWLHAAAPSFAFGTWQHVTCTYDDATKEVVIYINGVDQGSATLAVSPITNNKPLWIGYSGHWNDGGIDGDLDEIRIYNRALTDADAAALYNYTGSTGGGPSMACDADHEAVLIYNPSYKAMQYCDGADWIQIARAGPSVPPEEPDAYSFTDVTEASLNVLVTSNTITPAGYTAAASVNVSGDGSPEISINGGAWGTTGTINPGETIAVRLTTPGTLSTVSTATVVIGGIESIWTVTNTATDTQPDAFSFTDQTGVALNTLTTSNSVTISGMAAPASVSVSGDGSPQISIAGGAWVTSGTISSGQSLQVRLTSDTGAGVERVATVNVGGVAAAWSVTTVGPDTTPNAFTFADVTGAAVSTLTTSANVTIGGINSPAPVSVTGAGAQVSIAGGAWVTSGTITNGQTLAVRTTSSASTGTAVTATVNVGGVSDVWSVTTSINIALNGAYRRWSNGTYARNCKEYRIPAAGYSYTGDTGTGTYRIDIDGTGSATPFDAYCDMTTSGGGWTRIINGSGTTVAELGKFGTTSSISSTYDTSSAGVSWGSNNDTYRAYILNIPFSSYKITYSGTYTGGMGWMRTGSSTGGGGGVELSDAWNANSGGQSLQVNNSTIFDQAQTNVSDRTDTINSQHRYISMKGYTSSYTYNPRWIKYLWVK